MKRRLVTTIECGDRTCQTPGRTMCRFALLYRREEYHPFCNLFKQALELSGFGDPLRCRFCVDTEEKSE